MPSFADQLWEDAAAPLHEEFNGVSVTYVRGVSQIPNVTAIADVINYTVEGSDGLTTVVTLRDYTLRLEQLLIGGVCITPRAGDEIIESIAGVDQTFQLVPVGKRPCYELQPGGFRWTVHTNRVAS